MVRIIFWILLRTNSSVNGVQDIFVMEYNPKLRDFKLLLVILDSKTLYRFFSYNFLCYASFFYIVFVGFCFVFSRLGFMFFTSELYVVGLDMVYHSKYFYFMCCMCGDNNGCKR